MHIYGGAGSSMAWVVDVEKTLGEADASVEVSQWQRHSIYRVPARIRDLNPSVYRPHTVSLGPFYHGDPELVPMEEHKRRALRHLLRRAKRPLLEFVYAVEEVAEQLESAYLDLGANWRGSGQGGGRERFLEMMILDGCFLLEVMRAASELGRAGSSGDYAPNDPIFSPHGVVYMIPYICYDMLVLENQLPLLVLQKLVVVETGKLINDDSINRMVLRFLSPLPGLPSGSILSLHALDLYRRSMLYLYGVQRHSSSYDDRETDIISRSVVELYQSGIQLTSRTNSLRDIRFRRGVLRLPTVSLDDSSEHIFLDLMAFERLHVGAGNDVTAYVFLMNSVIKSPKDVAMLSSLGILRSSVGDAVVVELFRRISKDIVLEPDSHVQRVLQVANAYCRRPWSRWRAYIVSTETYSRGPWALFSLAAAAAVLAASIMQTVYAVLQFYRDIASSSSTAPAPM